MVRRTLTGVIEFNEMFASFKDEGAARRLFSHYILKSERTLNKANPRGTLKSSDAFSDRFRSRLSRAFESRRAPTKIRSPRSF